MEIKYKAININVSAIGVVRTLGQLFTQYQTFPTYVLLDDDAFNFALEIQEQVQDPLKKKTQYQ